MATFFNLDQITEELKHIHNQENETVKEIDEKKGTLKIEKVNIRDFCTRVAGFEVFENDSDIKIANDVVLAFYTDHDDKLPFIFKNTTTIPLLHDAVVYVQGRCMSTSPSETGKIMEDGIIIDQFKDPYGLFMYLPFKNGKKIYGFYQKTWLDDNSFVKQFIKFDTIKDDSMPSIEITNLECRSLNDSISETDKILISNNSPKFRKMTDNWKNVFDALSELDRMLYKTVDPNYIEKIIFLNNQISFPPFL